MNHYSISISEQGADKLFQAVRDTALIEIPRGNWITINALALRLDAGKGHLENGIFRIIRVGSSYRMQIKELDLVWDRLDIGVGIDIPETCIGGFCILKNPWGGCIIRAPRKCFFKTRPDLQGQLRLAGLRHEISSAFEFKIIKKADKWEVILDPKMPLDIDFIDLPDMVGEALDRLIKGFIRDILSLLPDWAVDFIIAILGNLVDMIRAILDLGDDVMEWISEKIGVSLGLENLVISLLLRFFYDGDPIFELENPYEVLEEEKIERLPPVMIPIENLGAEIHSDRIELSLTLGATA